MKKCLFLLIIVVAVSLMPAVSSAFSLFPNLREIKVMGGYFSCAVYRQQNTTPDSFIGYVDFSQMPSGNLMAKGDVPYGVFLKMKLRLDPIDRVDTGRWAKIMAHGSNSATPICNCADCVRNRSRGIQNMVTLVESSNTLYLEAWYAVNSVEEIGFTLMGRAKIKGERDLAMIVTIPVTPVSINEWIGDPSAAGPASSSGGIYTASQPTMPVTQTTMTLPDKTIDIAGNGLVIRVLGSDGSGFRGDGSVTICANGKTIVKTYRGGMLEKNGQLCNDNCLAMPAPRGTCFTVKAEGFCRSDRVGDTLTLYGGAR